MYIPIYLFKILIMQPKGTTGISFPNMFAFPIFRKRHLSMKKKICKIMPALGKMSGRRKSYTCFFSLIFSITIKAMNKDFNSLIQNNMGILIDSKRLRKHKRHFHKILNMLIVKFSSAALWQE